MYICGAAVRDDATGEQLRNCELNTSLMGSLFTSDFHIFAHTLTNVWKHRKCLFDLFIISRILEVLKLCVFSMINLSSVCTVSVYVFLSSEIKSLLCSVLTIFVFS